MRVVFSWLFPFGPAWNASALLSFLLSHLGVKQSADFYLFHLVLGTLYISSYVGPELSLDIGAHTTRPEAFLTLYWRSYPRRSTLIP